MKLASRLCFLAGRLRRGPIPGTLAGVFLAVALSCTGRPAPSAPPNVILITFDTLRADHLGCYGYARPTSPHLDAFAAAADFYPLAVAASSWTVPTHASIFTGRYPFEHGAHGIKVEPHAEMNAAVLGQDHTTLAEVLQAQGYDTAAYVANTAFLNPYWQLTQGFASYGWARVDGAGMNRKVFKWLDDRKGRPFFLFINYMDTHRPYNTTPREGLLDEPVSRDKGLLDSLYAAVMPGTGPVPRDLAGKVIDQYDTAVANVDEHFGALVARLKAAGLYENTTIVVTSDHGEFFGEHHLVEHSKDIYEEGVRVPLIVKNPGQTRGRTVPALASSVDIPALVLAGFPGDPARAAAVFPFRPGRHPVLSEIHYTRLKDLRHPVWGHRFRRIRTALYAWPYKVIRSSDGNHELYRVGDDPGESRDLAADEAERTREMLGVLGRFQEERTRAEERAPTEPLTEEQMEQLRSLGYID